MARGRPLAALELSPSDREQLESMGRSRSLPHRVGAPRRDDSAGRTGLSKDAVHRIWRTHGLQPHRQKHFKLSTDPFFVDKVRDNRRLVTCIPRSTPWSCAWTRRARSRRWNEVSRRCPWAWDTWKASRTTTSGTAPPPCSPPWTWPRET